MSPQNYVIKSVM